MLTGQDNGTGLYGGLNKRLKCVDDCETFSSDFLDSQDKLDLRFLPSDPVVSKISA